MTVPTNVYAAGFKKSLKQARDALEDRLMKRGDFRAETQWEYHQGAPDLRALPTTKVAVWLKPTSIRDNPSDGTFQGTTFLARWTMVIVIEDSGNDPFGFDLNMAEETIGDIIALLYNTNDDVALDGVVDFTVNPSADFDIGASGDRKIGVWTVDIDAQHPLLDRCV